MQSLTLSAPAKINTHLRIVGQRDDGYHLLQMVMVKLSLSDRITVSTISQGIEFEIEGSQDEGMKGDKNLVVRAAKAFCEMIGTKQGVRIHLQKNIPLGAGLAGGSSDAAAILRALNQLWNVGMISDELARIGVKLGADVPFFCYEGAAFVEGIGEKVDIIQNFPKLFLLLLNPGFSVSTHRMFQVFDEGVASGHFQLTPKWSNDRFRRLFKGFEEVTAFLQNDLEKVTLKVHPEIETMKSYLVTSGAEGVLMSGSGPTVFGLFSDRKQRDQVEKRALQEHRWQVFATESVS